MYRRQLTLPQIAFAMALGTAGGVYIYGPYFRPLAQEPQQDLDSQKAECPSAGEKASVLDISGQVDSGGTVQEADRLPEYQNKV